MGDQRDRPATVEVTDEVRSRLARAVLERFGEGASIAWAQAVADDLLSDAFSVPLPDRD